MRWLLGLRVATHRLSSAIMSSDFPTRPDTTQLPCRFLIVASEYNRRYVDGLISSAQAELEVLAPKATVSVYRVPGSFEIPLAVRLALKHKGADAVFAFGVIFNGATLHASLIAEAITAALVNLSLERETPVFHEVIVVDTEQQAEERCILPKLNRGTEAARAAIRMLKTIRLLKEG